MNPTKAEYATLSSTAKTNFLEAQAVAARSWTTYHYLKADKHGSTYDVCANASHCQKYDTSMYNGLAYNTARATASEIMIYIKNFSEGRYDYVDAVYSHSCTGSTKNNESVWSGSTPLPYFS